MKVLALLRHAKAVKDHPDGDHARPLSSAGREAATVAGQRLGPHLPEDFLVAASDAQRTRETAQQAFPDRVDGLRLEPGAYAATPKALLALIRDFPSDVRAAVLVGHNPGLSELALQLAGRGEAEDLARVAEGLATADAVVLEVPDEWQAVAGRSGRVTAFLARKGEDG